MDYDSRLERLEQRLGTKPEWWRNTVLLFYSDSGERPYDRIAYRETYGGEESVLARDSGESVPELEARARETWGLGGKHLMRVHYVSRNTKTGRRFTNAAYEAVGAPSPNAVNHDA
jgi:hypothetical protein